MVRESQKNLGYNHALMMMMMMMMMMISRESIATDNIQEIQKKYANNK